MESPSFTSKMEAPFRKNKTESYDHGRNTITEVLKAMPAEGPHFTQINVDSKHPHKL